jgi:Ca-activated chloride channel family protein
MTRLNRIPRTFLLLTALSLLGACDHQKRDALGPLDKLADGQRDANKQTQQPYVAPVDLELDATLANALVPADAGSELVARIRIEAPTALDLPRPPARVVLVVDTSASMKGDAIEGAKQAATVLVDSLADGDVFSLVVYHSRAETLMSATLIGDESRAAAKAEIERMQAWGTTDLGNGLRLALEQLSTAAVSMAPAEAGTLVAAGPGVWTGGGPDPSVLERIVLLGDGVPNDASQIPSLTQQFAARGAEITALGYGLEYDEVMLASLAEQTHGHFHFVEKPEAVAALFRDEVLHIQRTVARDLRLALGLGPGIGLIEVVGHTAQWNPSMARNEIVLGSIAEGQTHELIVRLAVGPHRDGVTVELSDLELAFTDVYTGTGNRFERNFLSALASADGNAVLGGRNLEIARAGARARTSAATLQVLSLARSGSLEQSKQLLGESVKWAKDAAKSLEDDELRKQAEQLAALEPELRALARQAQQGVAVVSEPGHAPQPFPGQPAAAQSIDGARAVKSAHSAAYNEIHN